MAPRGTPGLRVRTARGGAVNAAFLSGAELLVLGQNLLATALLGPGLIGLAGQWGARLPARGARRAPLVTWNGGTLLVAVADLVPSAAGVLVGSIVLVVALVLFARGLREVSTTANRPARGWTAAYVVLLIFLAGSVVIGTLLAFARGR
jgi:hypothetical protein